MLELIINKEPDKKSIMLVENGILVEKHEEHENHQRLEGNIYCGISIYDKDKSEWVTKWDCGKESFSEAEKGEASDSFKRAGFNWGIGRELYTSPFIWISNDKCNIKQTKKTDKYGNPIYECKDNFYVEAIQIIDKAITGLAIKNATTGKRVFVWKKEEK